MGVDDVDSKHEYSFEQSKQKLKKDMMIASAKEKKVYISKRIAKIRKSIKRLVNKNSTLPRDRQLKPEDFDLDPNYRERQKKILENAINVMIAECEPERAKFEKQKEFLENFTLHNIEVENIIVSGLDSDLTVRTFRTRKIPEELDCELQLAHMAKNEEENKKIQNSYQSEEQEGDTQEKQKN